MHETSALSDNLEKKHCHRPWLIMGSLVLVLLGVLVWLVLFYDASAPDDADMMPRWSERGGNTNPLAKFLEAASATKVPPEMMLPEQHRAGQADEFLKEQQAMFTALEELMRTNPATWQWPEAQRMLQFKIDETPAYYTLLPNVTGTIRLKALRLAYLGRIQEGAELCLMLARLGHGAQGAEGGFLEMMQMMRAQQQGEMLLEKVLTSGEAPPALLRHCMAELERFEGPNREGALFAMKMNYQWFKHLLSQRSMRYKLLDKTFPTREVGWVNRVLVKPNHCLMIHLEHDRPLLQGLSKGWPEAAAALHTVADRVNAQDWVFYNREPRWWHDSNIGGQVLVTSELKDQNDLVENLLRAVVCNRQIRIVLAMRLYELEKGTLPETLEALVPAYLPSVPVDEHSGGAMKMGDPKTEIYSVGIDRRDNDGAFTHGSFEKFEDIGTRYWWWASFSRSKLEK